MGPIRIKGMAIGEGAPKIIISVMGADADECISIIEEGKRSGVDMFEWRGDFNECRYDNEKMVELGRKVAASVPNNPLLFTFRSVSQGGNDTMTAEQYVSLNTAVIENELVDIVDIETWIGDDYVKQLVNLAHKHGVKALVSYHNFAGTPSTVWMVDLMTHMLDLGADIPKCAVMAHDTGDALKLMAANEEVKRLHTTGPALTMAMGLEGSISRLAGEYHGNDITFCALHESSAPGQVSVAQARKIIDELREVLCGPSIQMNSGIEEHESQLTD